MPLRLTGLTQYLFTDRKTAPSDTGDAVTLVDRLAHGMDIRLGSGPAQRPREAAAHILGPSIVDRRILIVAEPRSSIQTHLGWLDQNTRGVFAYSTPAQAVAAAAVSGDPTVLIVDIDLFVNVHVALDVLSNQRKHAPQQVTVIGSERFTMHDMSCERGAIADASIRLPVSRPELALALGAAVSNNGFIRGRGRLN
ncbi:hypothetical protein [Roseicyclus sp.]|uniref:hypothetical protein n=1 Tax=Roseicyclus sp. TaxID=1914329 RepID=UPI003F6AA50A